MVRSSCSGSTRRSPTRRTASVVQLPMLRPMEAVGNAGVAVEERADELADEHEVERDETTGRITSDQCRDLNAGSFHVVMTNLIGDEAAGWHEILAERNACLHLYGKAEARPGRKMGHVTRLSPAAAPAVPTSWSWTGGRTEDGHP